MNQTLLGKIDAVRQRVKILVWQRAISFSLATVIAALIAIGLVDWSLGLEFSWIRFGYSICCVAIAAWTLWRWILPAIRYKPNDVQVARRIERTVGREVDELATSVQLARQNDRDGRPNNEMESELIGKANRFFDSQSVSSLVSLRPIVWPMLLLALMGCICGVLFEAREETAQRSLRRLAMPWIADEWPRRNDLAIEQLPNRVAAGGSVSVVAVDRNGQLVDEIVTAEIDEFGVGGRQRFELTADVGDGSIHRGVLDDVKADFRIRVTGGDDASDWYPVEVVDIPRIVSLEVQIEMPPGIGSNGFGLAGRVSKGPIKCWAGSTIVIRGKSDSPIRAATLKFASGELTETWPLFVDADQVGFRSADESPGLTFPDSGEYWIELEGLDQTDSTEAPRWPVEIVADTVPQVDVILLDEIAGLDSLVPVRLQITDRPGIRSAGITVTPIQGIESRQGVASPGSVNYELPIEMVSESAETFERTWSAQTLVDVAQWKNLKGCDQLSIRPLVIDLAGQESDSDISREIEVVSIDRLIDKLNRQSGRLGRLLSELELRQTALNSRTRATRELLLDPDNGESSEQLRRRIRQVLVSQQRVIDLFEKGDQSSRQVNRAALNYASRHRLTGNRTADLEKVMTIQEMAASQVVGELRTRMIRIGEILRSTGVPGPNTERELVSVIGLQESFATALGNAAGMLKVAADYEQLVEKAKRLHDEQVQLAESTAELNRQKTGVEGSRGAIRLDSISLRQSRLNSAVERFADELVALVAADNSGSDPRSDNLNRAIEQIGNARLPNIMLQTDLALDENRPGVANELQRRIASVLSMVLSTLNPGNISGDEILEGTGGLADQINELVDQLEDVDAGLREFSDSGREMDAVTRRDLDQQKDDLQGQLSNLRNAVDSSEFAEVTGLIDEAIADVAGSPGSVRTEDIENESRKIRSAITRLQSAALAIASQTTERNPAGNLSAVHEFLLQLLKAQIGINEWTENQLAGDQATTASRGKIVDLQRQVGTSFVEATSESLAGYPTAGILVDGIENLLLQSGDRLESKLMDRTTTAIQARIVNQMRQLIEAIEIQLEASKQTPTSDEDEDQDADEADGSEGGIRSFELTMLYVMQKNVRQQAEMLRQQMELEGGETPELARQRRELSELQMQIASVLGELLDAHEEAIPALPDF